MLPIPTLKKRSGSYSYCRAGTNSGIRDRKSISSGACWDSPGQHSSHSGCWLCTSIDRDNDGEASTLYRLAADKWIGDGIAALLGSLDLFGPSVIKSTVAG